VYEAPSQIEVVTLPVVVAGVIDKFKVAVLHPSTTVTPDCAVVYDCPLAGQVYEAPSQIEVVTLPVVVAGVIDKFNVAVLHPSTKVVPL
jgi:hypothetical protein